MEQGERGKPSPSGGGVCQSALAENGALVKEARHLTSEMVPICGSSHISTSSAWSLSLERILRVMLSPEHSLLQPLPLVLLIPLSFSHTLTSPSGAVSASLYSLSFSLFLLPSSPLLSFLFSVPSSGLSFPPFSSLWLPLLPFVPLYHSLSVSIFPFLHPPHQPQPQQEPFVSRSSAGGSRNLLPTP